MLYLDLIVAYTFVYIAIRMNKLGNIEYRYNFNIYLIKQMGLFLSKIWRRLFSHEQEFKLVIIGLQNAGKTTILYKLYAKLDHSL